MPKQKAPKGAAAAESNDSISDARFSSFATDPRFRLPSKKHTRTKIDKRFSRMLEDDDFSSTAKVDRYGRKISSTSKKQALQRLYQPEEAEDEEESPEDEENAGIEVEDDEVVAKELKRADAGYDAARGGGFSSSEDEEDEDEEEGGVEIEEIADFPDLQEEQAGVPMGEVSKRFACVNMDFDNIRAVDLFAVFSSFVPVGGKIVKISVFQSEFGKERMEREELEGPPKEIFNRQAQAEEDEEEEDDSEDESEDEEAMDEKIKQDLLKEDDGKEFDSGALRQYQLERLRYFYAVVVCSDERTAEKIYEATDGKEFLSSANYFDLRFVPDETDFDDKPREECDSIPSGYRPAEFVTDALQHSKVKLTWDAEDTSRKEVINRAFSGSRAEIGENDLKAYLGSDSSDDEDELEAEVEAVDGEEDVPKLTKKELARQKMRAALGLTTEPTTSKPSKSGPVGDMEITFTSGLSGGDKGNVFQNAPIKDETTAEAYVRKEKERKTRRKEAAKAKRQGQDPVDNPDETEQAGEEEDLGFNDPFFANADTTETKKDSKSKSLNKEERKQRRETKAAAAAASAAERATLSLLMNDAETAEANARDFDLKSIRKSEKLAKKSGKARKFAKQAADADGSKRGGLQEGFEMDVADPRFSAVFENHEFAINPHSAEFKRTGTEGMKKLVEEGRRKRRVDDGGEEREEVKRVRKGDGANGQKNDLSSLVESVKRKAKR